jgi:oxygen-dependent protoporphyrinogen oxidase
MDAVTEASSPLDDLARAAHGTRVVVIGGGIAGLVAALECAKVGLAVTVCEASDDLGGAIGSFPVDGVEVPTGADGYATAGGHVRRLVDELGLGDTVAAEGRSDVWVAGRGIDGGAAPVPADAILGIPSNTWDPAVRRIVGWRGVWRAYLDRLRPPLTIGVERNLDRLVRGRMGDLVADRLVAPLTFGRFGLHPSDVDVTVAAPGLSSALTRTGSLSGGVAQLAGQPRPGYETIDGGMPRLVAALRERLLDLGADVRVGERVDAVRAADESDDATGWHVVAGEESIPADLVIVAADEGEARLLLSPLTALDTEAHVTVQEVVTIVVDEPRLDACPRGAVVHPLPDGGDVAAVAHVTARWPSLAARVGEGRHIVRVTFRAGDAVRDEADAVAAAVAAASTLLGVEISHDRVRGAQRTVHRPARPASALGHAEATEAVRAAVTAVPGLAVVGAWVSGSGLAQVVPDAVATADAARRAALWGSAADAD